QLRTEVVARRPGAAQRHERLNDLTTHGVRLAHHRGLDHGRMLDEGAFDFKRSNAIAGAFDHVVGAPDKPVVTIRVAHRAVPGQIPVALEASGVLGRVAPVFPKQPEWSLRPDPDRDLAFLA